jgi:hypothetical protein
MAARGGAAPQGAGDRAGPDFLPSDDDRRRLEAMLVPFADQELPQPAGSETITRLRTVRAYFRRIDPVAAPGSPGVGPIVHPCGPRHG